tara:strand:- start:12488 stop:15115 length:2628 start_codon:yes stop_codon:yes gene_type:complete
MARVKIKKLPQGMELKDGKLVRVMASGGATRTGDQRNYGLVKLPELIDEKDDSGQKAYSEVNKTLGPVPRDEANLEAEKGETVLTDMNNDGDFELYEITGNRHSSGGTPLRLPPQSFVYSDTQKMKFNKDELAELGLDQKKKITPADASKKFGLNEFIEKLDNEYDDPISKETAHYMLDKNKMKLSHIAFLQEHKKEFKEGVPLASYPYIQKQGIDPIQFSSQVQGITEQEAQAEALLQMPVDMQAKIMELKNFMQQVSQKDAQETQAVNHQLAMGEPPVAPMPQGQQPMMPPQGQPMAPPPGMPQGDPMQAPMPPQQPMAPPQDMAQQPMPPMGQPMVKEGGDPFMNNDLYNFMYGGDLPKAQNGRNVYYSPNATASMDALTPYYSITMAEDIGEGGYAYTQKGPEGGYYGDVDSDHMEVFYNRNKDIMLDMGIESYDQFNPETHTQDYQNKYNERLKNAWDNNPDLQQQFRNKLNNQDAGWDEFSELGFYGPEGSSTHADNQFGEYTWSRPGLNALEVEEDPCPNRDSVKAQCDAQGLPFIEAECRCGEGEKDDPIQKVTEEVDPEFWLQDKMKVAGAIANKFNIKKRYPWAPTYDEQQIDPVFTSPDREIAALSENANQALTAASKFSGPQRTAAFASQIQGKLADQINDTINKNAAANIKVANDSLKTNALLAHEADKLNKASKQNLYDKTILTDENYDIAVAKANEQILKHTANAYTNRAYTHNLNELYPQFNINPETGGIAEFDPKYTQEPQPKTPAEKDAALKEYIRKNNELKKQNMEIGDMPEELRNQIFLDGNNPGGDDQWKNLFTDPSSSPYPTGPEATGPSPLIDPSMLGYPGAKWGKETRKQRIARKGAELRQWFSPLRKRWV